MRLMAGALVFAVACGGAPATIPDERPRPDPPVVRTADAAVAIDVPADSGTSLPDATFSDPPTVDAGAADASSFPDVAGDAADGYSADGSSADAGNEASHDTVLLCARPAAESWADCAQWCIPDGVASSQCTEAPIDGGGWQCANGACDYFDNSAIGWHMWCVQDGKYEGPLADAASDGTHPCCYCPSADAGGPPP